MELLHVDTEKCTICGACAAVCPAALIDVSDNGPEENGIESCVACGHCVAVCPVEALDNRRAPLSGQVPVEGLPPLNAEAASRFLRSRRSTRSYTQEEVPRAKLLRILDIARFASTGGNTQGISYLVIGDKQKLKQVSEATISWMETEVSDGSERAPYFSRIIQVARTTGRDVILRNAPHLIVALCDKDFLWGQANAQFSLTYAELFAPTLGVGTCWAGLVMGCAFSGYAPLLDILGIQGGKRIAGALMAGYPRYAYHRLVDRNPLSVEWK
jgi:nitroreductase/NAD-dependent dihydropyrimidine dehydrogenase PreA subunit